MARKQVLVQLDDVLLARLDAEAKRSERSRSELIRRAVHDLLQRRWYEEAHELDVQAYTRFPEPAQQPWDEAVMKATADYLAEVDPEPWLAAEEPPTYGP